MPVHTACTPACFALAPLHRLSSLLPPPSQEAPILPLENETGLFVLGGGHTFMALAACLHDSGLVLLIAKPVPVVACLCLLAYILTILLSSMLSTT